jgi:hypothetical protein
MTSLDQRRALLTAALGFMQLDRWNEPKPPAMTALARWMDSWPGLGAIVGGMTAQGHNVEMREYPLGWRVNFYWTGTAHSVITGSAWEPTPWRAVQKAAWETLNPSKPIHPPGSAPT